MASSQLIRIGNPDHSVGLSSAQSEFQMMRVEESEMTDDQFLRIDDLGAKDDDDKAHIPTAERPVSTSNQAQLNTLSRQAEDGKQVKSTANLETMDHLRK